jgi:hypothetical protein
MVEQAFSGGGKLEIKLRDIARSIKKGALSVGFLAGATYPDGTSIPMVATIQEFGAPRAGIPPRPYFRTAVQKHKGEWGAQIADQLPKANYDTTIVLDRMGAVIASEVQESIRDLVDPALSPVTLMIRQIVGPNGKATFTQVLEARRRVAAGERASGVSTKPLIWTSLMLNSVSWRIDQK